jgi:hypothetical protein
MKNCKTCGKLLEDSEFPYRPHSKTFRKSCKSCENKARINRTYSPPTEETKRKHNLYSSNWQKKQRANPDLSAKYIVKDSKNADKKANRENDLTIEYVENLVKDGCSYCGDKLIRMTADRIDNNIGHTKENVVAACYRCNMIRGNMPYEAWLNIAASVKDTFEKGLFKNWNGFGPWSGLKTE